MSDQIIWKDVSCKFNQQQANELVTNKSNSKKLENITFVEPNIELHRQLPVKDPYKSPTFSNTNVYLLQVVEQPIQCRMSGYGEKDRRPIDPAPIVQLTVINCLEQENFDVEKDYELESPFYVVHASLWSEDMQTQYDLIEGALPRPLRFLVGSLVNSPTILKNLKNENGLYFAFPELSVRTTGRFRLRFSLIHLAMNKVITEVFSEIFTVYPAKSYPGMKETSELSKHLARQGLKLTVRTQLRTKKR